MRRAAVLFLLVLAACGEDPAGPPACLGRVADAADGAFASFEKGQDGRGRVTYDDGMVLDVPLRPKRIVSTAPGITETVAHLDGLDHLVGRTPHCNFPAGMEAIPEVTVMPINTEGILALEPDLVIADRTLHRGSVDALRRRFEGRLLLLETSRAVASYERSVSILGVVLDAARARKAGRLLVSALREKRTDLAGAPAGERAPRVLIVSQWDPLYVEGPGSLMHDMLRVCGCVNVACDLDQASGTFSEELVMARKPDVILYRQVGMPARLRERWWDVVPALRSARLGYIGHDAYSRGGPRLVTALSALDAVLRHDANVIALEVVK